MRSAQFVVTTFARRSASRPARVVAEHFTEHQIRCVSDQGGSAPPDLEACLEEAIEERMISIEGSRKRPMKKWREANRIKVGR